MSSDLNDNAEKPLVSVIVPIYNREQFLPQLFDTIKNQTYENLEVILVDDGSTDGSLSWMKENKYRIGKPTIVLEQENAGHYDARNNGLDYSRGKYIAFQDSDDEWPNYHIEKMVGYLEENSDIDWLFGELQRIDHETRQVVEKCNLVREDGTLHPFIELKSEPRKNGVYKISSHDIGITAITHRVPGSTQSALIKKSLFKSMRFDPSYRTAYDQFFAVKCVLKGFQFGFVREIHQIYHVHNNNISLVNGGDSEKRYKSAVTHIRGFESLIPYCDKTQKKEVYKKIAFQYAWVKATAELEMKMFKEAISSDVEAIKYHPRNISYWKTFFATCTKFFLEKIN